MNRRATSVEKTRKVIRLGGSLVLSLPPEWLAQNGITSEDHLRVNYWGDLVIIRPEERAQTEVSQTEVSA